MFVRTAILVIVLVEYCNMHEIDFQLAPILLSVGALSICDLIIDKILGGN